MKNQICEIIYQVKDGEQILNLKVDKEIENIFDREPTETSEKYKDTDGDGLEFYALKPALKRLVRKYEAEAGLRISLEKYGTELFIEGIEGSQRKPNFSIVRTEGISEGIDVIVDDLITESELEEWTAHFASFLKFLYREYIDETPTRIRVLLER